MARVGVLFSADEAERAAVQEVLGDVAFLHDAPDPDVEVVLSFFPRRELAACGLDWSDLPRLRLLQSCTAGLNHIPWNDLPDVQVAAAPGATGPFIAEHVLAFVLAWARGLLRQTEEIRAGRFHLGAPVKALSELEVLVVGYGGIGRATADLLSRLGATVRAVNRSVGDPGPAASLESMGALPGRAATADVVVLCLPLTRETEGLVDAALLARMAGRDALLVNVARGPVVDEDALYDWLHADARHWAALDVWWAYPREGRPFHRPFHKFQNVIMTPHDSPNVAGHRLAMIGQAAHQVARFLATGRAEHAHEASWYRPGSGDGR